MHVHPTYREASVHSASIKREDLELSVFCSVIHHCPTTALMVLLALTDCFCSGFASVVMEEEKNNET